MSAQVHTRAHYELMEQFEREFSHYRLDHEDKAYWSKGNVYQSGAANELFTAYRRGHAYGVATSRDKEAPK